MLGTDTSKPLILLVFANDSEEHLPSIEQEKNRLLNILQPVSDCLDYELKPLIYSTIDKFIEIIDDNADRLVLMHFAGHSNNEVLRLDEGEAYANGLAGKLKACKYLKLLFLNGCDNAKQINKFLEVGVPITIWNI